MIASKIIKINKPKILENSYIENELSKVCQDVIRWAITDITDNDITITVSYVR